MGQANIAGMTSYVTWADIEPREGEYDWSRLDADIAIARAAGKKITIGVFTGKDALPDWIEAVGVRTWINAAGTRLIHPADAMFRTLWRNRVALLGQRYDADPTVIQVTICGAAGTLCGPRYPELPTDVTWDQLLAGWSDIADAYADAFPNTHLNLEFHLTVGFGADLPLAVLAAVPATVSISPFAEFLSDTVPTQTSTSGTAFLAAAQSRGNCGFQTVGVLGAALDEAVTLGRSYGCRYFEIYAQDVTGRPDVLSIPL